MELFSCFSKKKVQPLATHESHRTEAAGSGLVPGGGDSFFSHSAPPRAERACCGKATWDDPIWIMQQQPDKEETGRDNHIKALQEQIRRLKMENENLKMQCSFQAGQIRELQRRSTYNASEHCTSHSVNLSGQPQGLFEEDLQRSGKIPLCKAIHRNESGG